MSFELLGAFNGNAASYAEVELIISSVFGGVNRLKISRFWGRVIARKVVWVGHIPKKPVFSGLIILS